MKTKKLIVVWELNTVSRLDKNGEVLWTRTVGGLEWDEGRSIVQTSDGGFAIAGWTESYGSGGSDIYIIRLDSEGKVLWTRTVGGARDDMGLAIVQTTDGGFAIAGWTESYGSGGQDVYIIRLDGDGRLGSCSKCVVGSGGEVSSGGGAIVRNKGEVSYGGGVTTRNVGKIGQGGKVFNIFGIQDTLNFHSKYGCKCTERTVLVYRFLHDSVKRAYRKWWHVLNPERGEFETSEAFKARMEQARKLVCQIWNRLEERSIVLIKKNLIASCQLKVDSQWVLERYDADSEYFPLKIGGTKYKLRVPLSEAPSVKASFPSAGKWEVWGKGWDGKEGLLGYALVTDAGVYVVRESDMQVELEGELHPCLEPETIRKLTKGNKIASVELPPLLIVEDVSLKEEESDGVVEAYEKAWLEVLVANKGRGIGKSVNIEVDGLPAGVEIGSVSPVDLSPGQKKLFRIPIRISSALQVPISVRVRAYAVSGEYRSEGSEIVSFVAQPYYEPRFGIVLSKVEEVLNPNGKIEIGEELHVVLRLENRSEHRARKVRVKLINLSNDVVRITEPVKPSFAESIEGGSSLPIEFRMLFRKREEPKLYLEVEDVSGNNWRMAVPSVLDALITVEIVELSPPPQSTKECRGCAALVIGNQWYPVANQSVQYAIDDARLVAQYFRQTLGVNTVEKHMNLTQVQMTEVVKRFVERAKGANTIYFFYSGHGYIDSEGNPVLVPTDVNPDFPSSHGYPIQRLIQELRSTGAQRVIIFIDACYSGLGRESGEALAMRGSPAKLDLSDIEVATGGTAVVFSATDKTERAWGLPQAGHGAFTYCLLKTIKEHKGDIVLDSLYDNIYQCLVEEVPALTGGERIQHPQVYPKWGPWKQWRLVE